MVRKLVLVISIALLVGCASTPEQTVVYRTKEVKVPVYQKPELPDSLKAPLSLDALPQFTTPTDPDASSALTPEGEKNLKLLILELKGRLEAFEEWAK